MAYKAVNISTRTAPAGGSVTPTLVWTTNQGNLLIAWVTSVGSTNPINCTGSPLNGWTMACSVLSGTWQASIWYKANCDYGEPAPTFTCSGANLMPNHIEEFSGGAGTVTVLDKFATQTNTASPVVVTCAAPDPQVGNLVIVCVQWGLSAPSTVTLGGTPNNGVVITDNIGNSGASNVSHDHGYWGLTTSNGGGDSANETCTTAVINAAACIATFMPLGSTPAVASAATGPA